MNGTPSSDFDIDWMLDPSVYPHAATELQLLETHISWVVLTGEFAYKIKKPVRFDFVDYSTASRRAEFCRRELEFNRRFAPEIYLGVASLVRTEHGLRVVTDDSTSDPGHPVIEHAVRMRQFPQSAILARRMEQDPVPLDWIDSFGTRITRFHDSIVGVPLPEGEAWERVATADARDNFPMLREEFGSSRRAAELEQLAGWTEAQIDALDSRFADRVAGGYHRPCHGDLHLNNIICWSDRLIPFDGIEFNRRLQWVDVLNDVAFPIMDFFARGYPAHGWRLLNRYLEETGCYDQLDLLRYYLVYRALVRAKVTWLNPQNHSDAGKSDPDEPGPWDKYLDTATAFSHPRPARLAITHGLSGSGKSTRALNWLATEGGIRIRSDLERKRSTRDVSYEKDARDQIYDRLLRLADAALRQQVPVVVDATFLSREHREAFARLARELDLTFEILDCHADYDELCRRIRRRAGQTEDPSDATIAVLDRQIKSRDPLTAEERQSVRAE